ncbi:6-hydroxymethylpterin diphosphokinase MptE-like protein [Leptospira soteropolitanensis]|uniref:6-hydroxymethylpterin diphosphokinase MptE-like protein n=1 Tax=Leptospira soteropolitanensis TaxID=2950025 RepID=UPI002AC89246|nr:6-hydroxymethylpterin diphosphokinase MptE-like protein [Leptospira soteropolitanensis]
MVTGTDPNWSELKEKIRNLANGSHILNSKWSLYITPSYERTFPELIKNCQNNFQSQFSPKDINRNTIQHFSKLWTHNYLKNRTGLFSNDTRIHWFQSFSGKKTSVLFVGASPGLELDLPQIKKDRNHFLIFASDTAIGYLLPNGIIPDYIVSFDSGRGTTYHYLLDLPKQIPIITWLGGSSYIFELSNPKILVNTGHPLDQITEHLFQNSLGQTWPHYTNPSLNLLGMVLSITEAIKEREFFVSGVSYLAERGKSHCKGTGYERFYLPDINRKKSLEITTKRLYSGERKGKNQIAWAELNQKESLPGFRFLSEAKEMNFLSIQDQTYSLQSFQGFPPSIADLAKWADQDHSEIIHKKTLNTWLRFSLS